MPNGPALPGSDGDLAACHDAEITTDTIVPTGLGDKLDLDLAIWACFAKARVAAERAGEDQHVLVEELNQPIRSRTTWPLDGKRMTVG